jgi:hypothetical protein
MLKLIRDCAPWLNWKVGATFAAVVLVGLIAFGAQTGLLAILGATPLLAMAACLLPCLIPLVLLRGKGRSSASQTPADTVQQKAPIWIQRSRRL